MTEPEGPDARCLVELRVLDGPGAWFPRPAVVLTLDTAELLALPEGAMNALEAAAGLRGRQPGAPGGELRLRAVARLLGRVARLLARELDVSLAVRARPVPRSEHVAIAYPWRRRGTATAFGQAMARLVDDAAAGGDLPELLRTAATAVRAAEPGDVPRLPRPRARMPVVQITGTNGKTTTTRLLAHMARCAGHVPGWCNTDGVHVGDGRTIEEGDWSGPGGAARVLAEREVTFAVLETARGGILQRGMGVARNDVSVVTNVQADHLGLMGIHTLDQLAEVKASVVRTTRPSGTAVLNVEDPRVLAMRGLTKAHVRGFSLDPDSPGLREVLGAGGSGTTILDGCIALIEPGHDPVLLVPLRDVPMTVAGLSPHMSANALAATGAALAAGLPRDAVVEALRTFAPDPTGNPGRMNVFDAGGVAVVVDLAHNEDGVQALLRVARGLRAPGRLVRLVLGGVGDRDDDSIRAVGEVGARGADVVVVAEKDAYLRGRTRGEVGGLLMEGAREAGATDIPVLGSELAGLQAVLADSSPGDVCALMCHGERAAVYAWLAEQHAEPVSPEAIQALVDAANVG